MCTGSSKLLSLTWPHTRTLAFTELPTVDAHTRHTHLRNWASRVISAFYCETSVPTWVFITASIQNKFKFWHTCQNLCRCIVNQASTLYTGGKAGRFAASCIENSKYCAIWWFSTLSQPNNNVLLWPWTFLAIVQLMLEHYPKRNIY